MSYVKAYLHFVWSTKNRNPYLNTLPLRTEVWRHIYLNAIKKGIYIDVINGYSEHCHCLISLSSDQTMRNVMQLLKGESAYWINKNNLLKDTSYSRFEWQDEYYVVSVSPSILPKVRRYIKNQEEHHQKKSFDDEYNEFIIKYGFPPPPRPKGRGN